MKKILSIVLIITLSFICVYSVQSIVNNTVNENNMCKNISANSIKSIPLKEDLKLTHIANMGVLVSSGNKKIIIDGLFKSTHPVCINPSPETVDKIINGKTPYEGISQILITHKDQDHFNADLIYNYMIKHPDVIVIMPVDAIEAMRKAVKELEKIEKRIHAINLKTGESAEKLISDISITIMRTTHGQSNYPMNLMYLIKLNGWNVFHEGDGSGSSEDKKRFGLDKINIDLGIVQFKWPFHPHLPYLNYFKNNLKIDHIALAHIDAKETKTIASKVAAISKSYKDIFPLLPGMPDKIFNK